VGIRRCSIRAFGFLIHRAERLDLALLADGHALAFDLVGIFQPIDIEWITLGCS
jgi:hypothetical protein